MSNEFEGINFAQEKERLKIWGEVSDPKNHDPKNFRYLVHAFNPFASITRPLAVNYAEASNIYKTDKLDGDQSINLFNQPERLGERVSLSMSLIDQEHTATWGDGGLIIEAPEGNIVITSPTDTGSHNSSKDFLKKQAQNQLSGEQLLQLTSDKNYNEVVAFAKSENGEIVQLKGFFIKVDKQGQPSSSVIAEKMQQHAKILNLPIIEIECKGLYENEMIEITKNSILVNYCGNRYNLSYNNTKFIFKAYNYKGDPFVPFPQEIEDVVTHFVERGNLDQVQAKQILEKYELFDFQRKSPKVEYNLKTKEISRVVIEDGYGKDVIEYWLNPFGYCFKVNMEKYRKAIKESLLNPKIQNFDDSEYQESLSRVDILSILESRKEMMEPEEYKKVFNFFKDVKNQYI